MDWKEAHQNTYWNMEEAKQLVRSSSTCVGEGVCGSLQEGTLETGVQR